MFAHVQQVPSASILHLQLRTSYRFVQESYAIIPGTLLERGLIVLQNAH